VEALQARTDRSNAGLRAREFAHDRHPQSPDPSDADSGQVVVLINYLSRHQVPVYEALGQRRGPVPILVSVDVEPQRPYKPEFGQLDVRFQKNFTFHPAWRHASGFRDRMNVHVPYDTFLQLWRLSPDVVVSYELGMRSVFSAIYRMLRPQSRLVIVLNLSEHTERSWGLLRRLIRPLLLRIADVVTVNGPSCRRYVASLGVPAAKIRNFPYSADPQSVYRGPVPRSAEHRRRLLWVGQLTERKNPLAFWRQLSRWCAGHPSRTVRMTVVGEGPLRGALMAMPLPPNLQVDFVGTFEPQRMPPLWRDHGVLVFPTLADEWGMVVDEAMHSGLPVLASVHAQAGLALVEEGVNGWRFDPLDEADMHAAIDRMMMTPDDELERMGERARASVSERTPEWSAELLGEAIRACVPPRRRTAP
jgi:glycosyltransferase involved in cell wall biosynthesis